MAGYETFDRPPTGFAHTSNADAPSCEGRFVLVEASEEKPDGWCETCQVVCTRKPSCAHSFARPCACSGCPPHAHCKQTNPIAARMRKLRHSG